MSHHEPAYLLGIAGAMLAESGKIGYIGAFPTATAHNDVNGLLLGARTVNPDATVQAVMISSFFDPQKATQAANTLIDSGVEFLFAVMDEPSFPQVSNDRIWAATWNTDVREFGPEAYVNSFDLQWGDLHGADPGPARRHMEPAAGRRPHRPEARCVGRLRATGGTGRGGRRSSSSTTAACRYTSAR